MMYLSRREVGHPQPWVFSDKNNGPPLGNTTKFLHSNDSRCPPRRRN